MDIRWKKKNIDWGIVTDEEIDIILEQIRRIINPTDSIKKLFGIFNTVRISYNIFLKFYFKLLCPFMIMICSTWTLYKRLFASGSGTYGKLR